MGQEFGNIKGFRVIFNIYKIKEKIGVLWWYTIIMFCVQRLGDVINMILGLWVVPRYVSQDQLGAVLPLVQVGSVLGLPLGILAIPFKKYLNAFAAKGEYGKIKSLLRDMFMLAMLCVAGIAFYSKLVMPSVFERLRIPDTGLFSLIIILGVLNASFPVFLTALQALKDFRAVMIISFFSAPIRLVTMLLVMPTKGLSGYFVGHIAPLVYSIGVVLWRLRYFVGKSVSTVSYLKVDGRNILRYTIPVAVMTVLATLTATTESLVVRHRLPAFDSAGFYIISRFADISSYLGSAFAFVLFPLVAERHECGERSIRMLVQALCMIIFGGAVLMACFALWGDELLSLTLNWRAYVSFAPQMVFLSGIQCLRAAVACFIIYELACSRFGFVYCYSAVCCLEALFLYCITGFNFFDPYVPRSWLKWVALINPARLSFILQVIGCFVAISFCIMLIFVLKHIQSSRNTECTGEFSPNTTC